MPGNEEEMKFENECPISGVDGQTGNRACQLEFIAQSSIHARYEIDPIRGTLV